MSLTEVKIKNSKKKEKSYKLYDGEGLYLHMLHSGGRVWRYKYTFDQKEKLFTIGKYPAISLKVAREMRSKAYLLLSNDIDPAQQKKEAKELRAQVEVENAPPSGKSFKEVAIEWIKFKSIPDTKRCWKPTHSDAVLKSLEREVF